MRANIVRFGAMAVVIGSLFATAEASAQLVVPDACSAPRNARLLALGERKGASLARQAFASTDIASSCDNVDAFADIVIDIVDGLTVAAPSDAALCHFVGTVNGLLAQVEDIQTQCAEDCFLDGDFIGEIAGLLYCELSIALGGLGLDVTFVPGPVGLCGENFEAACFETFESTTTGDPLCEPFTPLDPPADPDFTEVWEQTRNNQCLFNPEI